MGFLTFVEIIFCARFVAPYNSVVRNKLYNDFSIITDVRKRDGLATLLLSIFYLQLSRPEANIAQLVW